MKPWYVHYLNKFPGGVTDFSESEVRAYCVEGKLRVLLRKNGAGQWADCSEELGLPNRHDLAPIPRDTRLWKLGRDGVVRPDELAKERAPVALALAAHFGGCVPGAFEIQERLGFHPDPRDTRLIAWECSQDPRVAKVAPKLAAAFAPQLEAPAAAVAAVEHNPPIAAEFREMEPARTEAPPEPVEVSAPPVDSL